MKITVLSGPDCNENYGDCFIMDDSNNLYIYDCGSQKLAEEVINYMRTNNYSKATAILSHNDLDHFNGLEYLVNKGKIEKVYTVCLLKYIDEILDAIGDGRKTRESLRNQILTRYDNIKKLSGYLEDIYPLEKKITSQISIVGPDKNYMIEAVAHELNTLEGDTIDSETVVNATSVQVKVKLDNGNQVLLCGDCSFEAIKGKVDNYNIIQLPHHGKEEQAKAIFGAVSDVKEKVFIVSDNTGPTNGGSDERNFIGKVVKNTKSLGTFVIDETVLKSSTGYVPKKSLGCQYDILFR